MHNLTQSLKIKHNVCIGILSFIVVAMSAFLGNTTIADEYQTLFSYCYGNMEKIVIEGRVIERRKETTATQADNWVTNSWRKLQQLINDEQEHATIVLNINEQLFKTQTGDEGFFNIEIPKPEQLHAGFHTVYAELDNKKEDSCQLLIIPPENTIGIISDFDDTVIVTEVLNKQQAISNTLTLNYKQRQAVTNMVDWYRKILNTNPTPDYAALFFVTGSPKQLQKGINQFLDYHHFPYRTIYTKKIEGENSDPLLNQLKYKLQKIENILNMFPTMNFVLIGDDGEKDPEVYHAIFEKFPSRVKSTWIRTVDPSAERKRYPEQQYFSSGSR